VFGELALGGMFALAIPPFFKVERGFYKSSASVYLVAGLVTAIGLAFLAIRGGASEGPSAAALWTAAGFWTLFSAVFATYLYTLWFDNGWLRARSFTLGLGMGIMALAFNAIILTPAGFGIAADVGAVLTALTSGLVLGLTSGAMLFGHWYLIDLEMPVDYLRTFMRVLVGAIIANIGATLVSVVLLWLAGGTMGAGAVGSLLGPNLMLGTMWFALGPAATIVLVWMCWQTLKIPQTMAATGLLYIAVMSVLVGEMLSRFILFRTSVPL